MMMELFLSMLWKIPLVLLVFTIVEHTMHRYLLHGKWLLKTPLSFSFRQHTVEHHGKFMYEDQHIDLMWIDYFAAIPFILSGTLRYLVWGHVGGLATVLVLVGACVLHRTIWNALHRSIHGLYGTHWIRMVPGYSIWYIHHMQHHLNPKTNYGVVLIWSDLLMGTRYVKKEGTIQI